MSTNRITLYTQSDYCQNTLWKTVVGDDHKQRNNESLRYGKKLISSSTHDTLNILSHEQIPLDNTSNNRFTKHRNNKSNLSFNCFKTKISQRTLRKHNYDIYRIRRHQRKLFSVFTSWRISSLSRSTMISEQTMAPILHITF